MLPMIATSAALASGLPNVDAPLRTGDRTPADAAVVVGIEDYAFLGDVAYAERDADAFAEFLRHTRGIPAERVQRVGHPANREKILAAVASAADLAGDDGRLWIYFAGHGATSSTTGERLLLGADVAADAAALDARAVPLPALLTAAGEGEIVAVLDACYTGQARGGKPLIAGAELAAPTSPPPGREGLITWTSASPNACAAPFPLVRHGAFTYFAIGAMRGWADGQLDGRTDGVVTAEEARNYVVEALEAAPVSGPVPVMRGHGDGDIVLIRSEALEPKPDPRVWHQGAASGAAASPQRPAAAPTRRVDCSRGPFVARGCDPELWIQPPDDPPVKIGRCKNFSARDELWEKGRYRCGGSARGVSVQVARHTWRFDLEPYLRDQGADAMTSLDFEVGGRTIVGRSWKNALGNDVATWFDLDAGSTYECRTFAGKQHDLGDCIATTRRFIEDLNAAE